RRNPFQDIKPSLMTVAPPDHPASTAHSDSDKTMPSENPVYSEAHYRERTKTPAGSAPTKWLYALPALPLLSGCFPCSVERIHKAIRASLELIARPLPGTATRAGCHRV